MVICMRTESAHREAPARGGIEDAGRAGAWRVKRGAWSVERGVWRRLATAKGRMNVNKGSLSQSRLLMGKRHYTSRNADPDRIGTVSSRACVNSRRCRRMPDETPNQPERPEPINHSQVGQPAKRQVRQPALQKKATCPMVIAQTTSCVITNNVQTSGSPRLGMANYRIYRNSGLDRIHKILMFSMI